MDNLITLKLDTRIIFLIAFILVLCAYYLVKTVDIWLENLEHKKARGRDLIFTPGNRLSSFIKYRFAKAYMEFKERK